MRQRLVAGPVPCDRLSAPERGGLGCPFLFGWLEWGVPFFRAETAMIRPAPRHPCLPFIGANLAVRPGVRLLHALLLGGLGAAIPLGSPWAQQAASSQIFVCHGAGGVPEYRNGPGGKGCRRLDLPEVISVPAGRTAGRAVRGPSAPAQAAPAAGAADFPRIDPAVQRGRDSERRAVLQAELQSELARLDALQAEYRQGQPERLGNEHNQQRYLDRVERLRGDIARSEANAAALRRELANLKE